MNIHFSFMRNRRSDEVILRDKINFGGGKY